MWPSVQRPPIRDRRAWTDARSAGGQARSPGPGNGVVLWQKAEKQVVRIRNLLKQEYPGVGIEARRRFARPERQGFAVSGRR